MQIQPRSYITSSRVAARPAPMVEERRTPARAVPAELDFVEIDTPEEALQSPLLEPSFQLSLAAGLLLSMAARGGGVPIIDISLETQGERQSVDLHATLDLSRQDTPVTSEGTVNGQDFRASITPDPRTGATRWQTQGHQTSDDLVLGMDPNTGAIAMHGRIGKVKTDLKMSLIGGSNLEEFQGFVVEGQVGGYAYRTVNKVELAALTTGDPATMNVRGRLGDLAIEKDYSGSVEQAGSTLTIDMHGEGQQGDEQTVDTVFTFIP